MSDTKLLDTRTSLDEIRGWFFDSDIVMFRWFLEHQRAAGRTGTVVELGAYLGKSTVVIGDYVADDEQFVVVDLFESDAPDDDNSREMSSSYSTLTRDAFQANYLRFHPKLPTVYTAPSEAVVEYVEPGTVRFMHIDASHLYDHVAVDVDSARSLLGADGIVVFDDYRSEHTPGVSAAVWEGVLNKGMRPIIVTESKLYATWGDPEALQSELFAWMTENSLAFAEYQTVAGHPLIRGKVRRSGGAAKKKSAAKKVTPPPPAGLRRFVRDWAPPRLLETARRVRARRRS